MFCGRIQVKEIEHLAFCEKKKKRLLSKTLPVFSLNDVRRP
jgi:hypothetical protein